MTRHPMHVAVNPALFMLTHLVRNNTRGIVNLRKGRWTGRAAHVFPGRAAIAAARNAPLFDACDDLVGNARVKGDAANMGGMGRRRKGPLAVFRQPAKPRQPTKRAATVLTEVNCCRQRADVN